MFEQRPGIAQACFTGQSSFVIVHGGRVWLGRIRHVNPYDRIGVPYHDCLRAFARREQMECVDQNAHIRVFLPELSEAVGEIDIPLERTLCERRFAPWLGP